VLRRRPAQSAQALEEPGLHIAERPSWDCRSCGRPWPCDSARQALRAEMTRTPLAIYMCGNLDEAVRDLPASLPSELFERFIGWTR